MMKAVLASGYYDPIHTGHIEYLEEAKSYASRMGAHLVVIVNNDKQAALKKGKPFMCEDERLKIVQSLRCVDHAFIAPDRDASVCESIREAARHYKIIAFAKGGDRFSNEIPEAAVCRDLAITIIDGLGLKIQSSSALIAAAGDTNAPTPLPVKGTST